MTIVETSNVGVKVGMVGRGVGGNGVMVDSFGSKRGVFVGAGVNVVSVGDGMAVELLVAGIGVD